MVSIGCCMTRSSRMDQSRTSNIDVDIENIDVTDVRLKSILNRFLVNTTQRTDPQTLSPGAHRLG